MMLEQHAIVLKTEGGQAWVEARESGTCGSCGAGGCSTRRLADLFGSRERAFPVDNVLGLRSGDRVLIGIPSGALWKSAFRLYGLPLSLFIAGALIGQQAGGDVGAVAAAAGGLLIAFLLQGVIRTSRDSQPVMLRRADDGASGPVINSSLRG
jgi:sigma-E factor negative regulatory protein RseC